MLKIRRYFLTGLLLILPVFITLYFLFIIFRFIDGILGSFINGYLMRILGFSIPGIGFIFGILAVFLTGVVASHFLGDKILPAVEKLFLRLPGIRQIYPPTKQIISFMLLKEKGEFKKVVLAEYPSKGIWSVGFATNDGFSEAVQKTGEDLVHVFIASTPGPWSGFFVLIPRKEVKFLDLSVEDGIKLIISGGILKPPC